MITAMGNDCGELPPAVDLETPELTGAALILLSPLFFRDLENIRINPNDIHLARFLEQLCHSLPSEWPANYPLWIAHYGGVDPAFHIPG